jgi:hypothetical protein
VLRLALFDVCAREELLDALVNYESSLKSSLMVIGLCFAWFCNQTVDNGDGSNLLFVWTAVRI